MRKIILKKKVLVLTPLAFLLGAASWLVYTKVLNQALCLAASQEDAAAVTRLLKCGANPNAVGVVPSPNTDSDTLPRSALSLAVDSPSMIGMRGMGPTYVTEYDRALPTTALLIEAGANVNARDEDGSTPLIEARSPRMVKSLLAHGAKVDLQSDGPAALMAHSNYFSVGEMNILLAAGADADARDDHGQTALMYALQQSAEPDSDPGVGSRQISIDTLEVVKHLIAAGANVNARDDKGKTALGYALDNEQTDSIKFLKKIGARR